MSPGGSAVFPPETRPKPLLPDITTAAALAMAMSPYAEESEQTKPLKRIRWATQRVSGRKGANKRKSIFNRHQSRLSASEKKRESGATDLSFAKPEQEERDGDGGADGQATGRNIYFNIPLPDTARDEEGRPLQHFKRNKIRTAKYTPISFIPKNLWFQFHNIANVYFLFIIILCVRICTSQCFAPTLILWCSSSPSSDPKIQV